MAGDDGVHYLLGLGIANGDTDKLPLAIIDSQGYEQNAIWF